MKNYQSEPEFICEMKNCFAGIENKEQQGECGTYQTNENNDAVLTDLNEEEDDMNWDGSMEEFHTLCDILHEAQAFGEETTLSEIKGTLSQMFNIGAYIR